MNGQKELLGEIKEVKQRLEKVEENQNNILSNQSLLSIGHATLVTNQQNIADSLERIESSDISKAEFMAQRRIIMEAKVSIKNVEASVCSMTGGTTDTNLEQIAGMLPLNTVADVKEVEDKLKLPDFAIAMVTNLYLKFNI
ncbi:uncharacterized protein LOC135958308 [Calliphora vicina]|uniref:uncharacterized protein LOC135958308 n=1 Tax=Calliphora vicina TaxID=7373 RepID=UPI00325B1512